MEKPTKLIIQQPVHVKGKFMRYKIIGSMQHVPLSVGDEVLLEKRPALNVSIAKMRKSKVTQLFTSTLDRAQIAEIEPRDFQTEESANKY